MTGAATGAQPDPLETILAQEQSDALQSALQNLTLRQRVVIRLKYAGDHSWIEIGVALQISEAAARRIHDRAIESLRSLLQTRI